MIINDRFRLLRKFLNISQNNFVIPLGVSRDVIKNIECGLTSPKEYVVKAICREYGVNREWLLNGTGEIFCTKEISDHAGPSFLSDFYSLSEEGQKEVSKYITAIIAAKKKEEED